MTKEWLVQRMFLFLATLFAMSMAVVWTFLALNYADDTGSFMLATGFLVAAALVIVGQLLASSSKTGLFGGTLLGLAVVVGSIVLYNLWRPFDNLDLGSLGLGFIGLLMIAAGFALVFIAASRSNRRTARRPVAVASPLPEPQLA